MEPKGFELPRKNTGKTVIPTKSAAKSGAIGIDSESAVEVERLAEWIHAAYSSDEVRRLVELLQNRVER